MINIFHPKRKFSLEALVYPKQDMPKPKTLAKEGDHWSTLGPAPLESLVPLDSDLSLSGVSFPKTIKTVNTKVSGNSIRYSCTVNYH